MSYCPKCGEKVTEEMSFCPRCGAPVKMQQIPPAPSTWEHRMDEKSEKGEKREKEEKEKGEKGEKGEKREYGFLGPLVGGLILIFLGVAFWLTLSRLYDWKVIWAFFLLLIGIVVIVTAIFGALVLAKRHPRP